jgi:serine/threonine protein kinase
VFKLNSTIDPKTGYSKAIDLWSVGIIISRLLCTKNPVLMYGDDNNVLKFLKDAGSRGIASPIKRFIEPEIGPLAAALIKKLCELDETKRITVKTALAHAWFSHSAVTESKYLEAIRDWSPRKLTAKLTEKIYMEGWLESGQPERRQASCTEPFVSQARSVPEEAEQVQVPGSQPGQTNAAEIYSTQDKNQKDHQRVQDILAQDMQVIGEYIDMLESVPRPVDWELPPSDVETELIQSSQSDNIIRRHGKLPMKQRRNLAWHNGVRKAKRQPKSEMRHSFHRQLKTSAHRFDYTPCLGDGFDRLPLSSRFSAFTRV